LGAKHVFIASALSILSLNRGYSLNHTSTGDFFSRKYMLKQCKSLNRVPL